VGQPFKELGRSVKGIKGQTMANDELQLRLKGWRMTTTEVLYFMPDHPRLIQSFVWQTLDLAPDFPRIRQFLEFWRAEIEATIHSIRVASGEGLAPARVQMGQEWRLN
jgi:uncharacterized protein Usg